MFDFLRRRIDYSTRMHLKRKARSVDYRFLLAVIALAIVALMAVRYL